MRDAAERLRQFDPDTIVVMSPHATAAADVFIVDSSAHVSGSLGSFGAPEATHSVPGDPELARRVLERLEAAGVPTLDRASMTTLEAGELDHGVLVPLAFLDPDSRWPLLVLSLSWLPYEQHQILGREVAAAARDLGRRIAFVASGDCSHRLTPDAPAGYDPRGAVFDRQLVELLQASDFDGLTKIDPKLIEAAGECGLRSFITLGAAAEPAHARVLTYEGPWGVGYLTALVNEELTTPVTGDKGGVPGLPESAIVSLARRAIEAYVTRGETIAADTIDDPDLPTRAGAFVSLHRHGELRGCIGTILAVHETLAGEVIANAISAATEDPRFPPLSPGELVDLDIKVDVLHAPEACTAKDLDPEVYGVIARSGFRRGLLLPDLEGVDTVEDQIAIACRKGGIVPGEPVELQRFQVDRHT
jgi:AmmeMemoRadiSam system protein A